MSTKQPLTTFMTLPPELHLSIASHLFFHDVYALRQTSRYFCGLLPLLTQIPLYDRDHIDELETQLVELETSFFGRSNGLLYCGKCLRLWHRKHFVRYMCDSRPRALSGFMSFRECLDSQEDAFGETKRRPS